MYVFLTLLLVSSLLVLALKLLSSLISESVVLSREELRAYECGFEHHNLSRIPFSLRYFFLTLIFLLFDLEVVLLFFLPSVFIFSHFYVSVLILVSFILFLFLALIYEWKEGRLDWVI